MVSTAVGDPTVRDEFGSTSYSNNDGSTSWSDSWTETGDGSVSATSGYVKISSGSLQLSSTNRTLSRQVDLSGAASATLSFQYKRSSFDKSKDYVTIEISANGGSTWTELARYAGPGSDSSWQNASFDILSYAAANTQIRFATSSSLGSSDKLYVDNVQIEYALSAPTPPPTDPPAPTPPTPAPIPSTSHPGMETVRDVFSSQTYNGDDGTKTWSTGWTEGDQSGDAEVSTEDVGVFMVGQSSYCEGGTGSCLWADPLYLNGYVYREVNLKNATIATLSLYRHNPLNGSYDNGEVKLEVSGDGGATWTTLRNYSKSEFTGSNVDTFDITAFAGENTRIRFYTNKVQDNSHYLYFDNIQIEYAIASDFLDTVGVNQLAQATGLNGQGITVAVVDSGITSFHPDFKVSPTSQSSRIIASTKFGSFLTTEDVYGHGTHVAGTIGGNGSASSGKYKGVAPGVNLVNVKVSDDYGMTYESDLVDGLQWIYDNKDTYNIRVVNISLNSTVEQSYHTSPLDAAVEILWFNGIVVVVSAGNNGTADGPSTLYPPANDPFVITVGATEDKGTPDLGDDNLAVFSAYGTTIDGFAKPDLVAPGRNIVAPLGGLLNIAFKLHPLHRVNDYYFRMSGTSMSAPVVSGAVALLLQDEPNLTPDQVKYRLHGNRQQELELAISASQSGAGYLDVYAAVYGTTTESANQGITVSQMLATGDDAVAWGSVGWNSVGWNSVGWNSVGWNSVGWNSVGWNSVGWNSVGWNSLTWDD